MAGRELDTPGFRLPPTASSETFWRHLAEGRPAVQWCPSCRVSTFPPRRRCPSCLGRELEWRDWSARGTLHSFTEVHRAGPGAGAPYVLALIDLAEGPGRLVVPLAVTGEIEIGMSVRIVARRGDDGRWSCRALAD